MASIALVFGYSYAISSSSVPSGSRK
jgi:hypothetical protein